MLILIYKGKELLIEICNICSNISSKLGSFYNDMLEHGYLDFETNPKISNVIITNYLTKTSMPIITGNSRNNAHDISSVFHEFGHAYQKYNASLEDKKHIVSALLKIPNI